MTDAEPGERAEPGSPGVSTGRPSKRRRWRLRRSMQRRGLLPRPPLLRALSRLAQNLPTQGNALEIFHDGDLLYSRMLEDIRNARIRIHIEMYMWLDDRTGWRFAHALSARAREGVAVRLIYDAVGSFGTSTRLFRHLRDAGVEVLEYHPVAPWRRRFALFRRNHRKNVIIDGRIGYTGGMNIADHWAGRRRGGSAWRDTQARIDGPAAGDMETLFAETWHQESGELVDITRTVPREDGSISYKEGDRPQLYVVGGRGGAKRIIRRMYLLSIGHARRRITITCSYFIPDFKLRRALRKACERGVSVRLLLPQRTDVTVARLAGEALFSRFLRWGISIHRWRPTVLHAKTAVVDGSWSIVGTSNMDSLSFRFNLETNLVIIDPETGADLEHCFDRDLRFSDLVTVTEWRRRALGKRLLERLAFLLRRFL